MPTAVPMIVDAWRLLADSVAVTGVAVVGTVGVAGAALMSETDTLTEVETWPSEFEVMLVSVEEYAVSLVESEGGPLELEVLLVGDEMSAVLVNWSLYETGSTTLPRAVWKNPLSLE
jgi:hypothetical protein